MKGLGQSLVSPMSRLWNKFKNIKKQKKTKQQYNDREWIWFNSKTSPKHTKNTFLKNTCKY